MMTEEKPQITRKVILPLGYEHETDKLMAPTPDVVASQPQDKVYILNSAEKGFNEPLPEKPVYLGIGSKYSF